MNLTFFIQSSTVNLNNYSIKDLPGSSGRFDVISRCVLAALLNDNEIEKNVQIRVFLNDYGTFIFDVSNLSVDNFPKTELIFAKYFMEVILNKVSFRTGILQFPDNPLKKIKIVDTNLIDALKDFLKNGYKLYILYEKGVDFFENVKEFRSEKNLGFVIGNQSGIDSEQLRALNLINVSFGSQSYLASSVIKLIKLYLLR
jgi:tRNA (pseudouridine54-N1)-methyltransferase